MATKRRKQKRSIGQIVGRFLRDLVTTFSEARRMSTVSTGGQGSFPPAPPSRAVRTGGAGGTRSGAGFHAFRESRRDLFPAELDDAQDDLDLDADGGRS